MGNQDASRPLLIEWGVAARPLPGETESGDLHMVKPFPNGFLVAVVDGLGHGPAAAFAARTAVAALEASPDEPVISLVKLCHEQLRRTRGVAMTLASIDTRERVMTWLGVGNVEGVVLRRDTLATPPREHALSRGGVVGEQLPPLRASVVSVTPGDTLILATDGISLGFAERLNLSEPPQKIADHILATYGKDTDDALVLVVRFVGLAQ